MIYLNTTTLQVFESELTRSELETITGCFIHGPYPAENDWGLTPIEFAQGEADLLREAK
jgi:hypothetical protein